MPDTYLTRLDEAARSAETLETEFRQSYASRLAALERDRVFAFRRLNLLRALSAAIEGADDEKAAIAAGVRVLRDEIGLSEGVEGHKAVIDRFAPVSDAVDTALNCEEPDHEAVLNALKAFEDWYQARTGQPFLALFDTYVPQTPVVDF